MTSFLNKTAGRVKENVLTQSISLVRTLGAEDRIKKSAFTLAEVLITLGIIGVIAALTLPSILANKERKELQAAFKKGYSELGQALVSMNAEQGFETTPKSYSKMPFYQTYMKYFQVLENCNRSDCLSLLKYKTFNKKNDANTTYFDDGQFILSDGTFIVIENPYGLENAHILITIDTNGIKKRPNAWGHDLFTFQIGSDGKLLPMGAEYTEYTDKNTYCDKSSTNNLNGIACAYYAMSDKDYWKTLP